MSVRVTWSPSCEPDIASYQLERATVEGGPWSLLATLAHADGDFAYDDATGTPAHWYRLRLANAADVALTTSPPLRPGSLVAAHARFVLGDGSPANEVRAVVAVVEGSAPIAGAYVTSDSNAPFVRQADAAGRLWVRLVPGSRVRVAIEGTPLVREFVVPSVGVFDLLQVMGAAPDLFSVQRAAPLLTRRSI